MDRPTIRNVQKVGNKRRRSEPWRVLREAAERLSSRQRSMPMGLKVIGAGWGRTGTLSLKLALEQLGFGPCHHMVEMFRRPATAPLWLEAHEGRADWDAIFADYASMTDFPGVRYWREIIAHYPEAKVVLTVRDPGSWFESARATVLKREGPARQPPPMLARFFETMLESVPNPEDREVMIEDFNRHNAEVIAVVPKERLLVYEVKQGWAPLCAFLGVPEPANPFPRENAREAFNARGVDRSGMPDLSELDRARS
jgi:hypothetical protein